ncbi:MAG: hypothetical protein JNM76_03455 [Betaproteobacteria bacterium]|nr:hypothetical protein [Betaproteobacteria bacterium]
MQRRLLSGLFSIVILGGCVAAPALAPATGDSRATVAANPDDIAAQAAAFGGCKRDAATRNLPLAQHQAALFECAKLHAGKRGEACLGQLILSKARVHELEGELAHCLRVMPK